MGSEPHLEADANYRLGEISGKIDLILVQMAADRQTDEARFTRIETTQEDYDARLTSLEQGRSWLLGGAAAITAAFGAAATYLGLK